MVCLCQYVYTYVHALCLLSYSLSGDQNSPQTQLVQPLPREAENPKAHNSGYCYVYISRTPFDVEDPGTGRIDKANWCTRNPRFMTSVSPRAVSLLPVWTCSDRGTTLP